MTTLACVLSPQVIILIGNKADLEAQRDVTYEEAKQFAEENGKVYHSRSPCTVDHGKSKFEQSLSICETTFLMNLIQSFVFVGLLFLEASAKT